MPGTVERLHVEYVGGGGATWTRGNVSVSLLPIQCLASGKEASGKARSKVALAGSPLTAWKRWQTAPRRESKVMRTCQLSPMHPRVLMSLPFPLPMGVGHWEGDGTAWARTPRGWAHGFQSEGPRSSLVPLQKAAVTRQRDSSGIIPWAPTTALMPQGKCPPPSGAPHPKLPSYSTFKDFHHL